MRAPVDWLNDYVRAQASANEIAATLTMLGLEVEEIESSDIGPVLVFKVTPNRGDCLSILGLARELAAKDPAKYAPTELFAQAVHGFALGDESKRLPDTLVTIEDLELCPAYGARLFESIPFKPSGDKIRARLVAGGMRPISVVVDTTNYVMIELGQPLHAFDRDNLTEGRIVVRRARSGETMRTLDDMDRALDDQMLVICDAARPVAIAGVMGGADSEVSANTKNVLLESAHFSPASIRRTRTRLGMNTDASYRFERFVDPQGVQRALNRFAMLLAEQTGVSPVEGTCLVSAPFHEPRAIKVRESRWTALLGMSVPRAAAGSSLVALGFNVTEDQDGLMATAPSWRSDIGFEEDLIEEIGRLWGYDEIPEALPSGATPVGGEFGKSAFVSSVRRAALRLGFTEVLTHSLRDTSPLDLGRGPLVRNPVSPELAMLRPSLLPGVAEAAARNRGRNLQLFEIGRVFTSESERTHLAMLIAGRLMDDHWSGGPPPPADFFALKGHIERLGDLSQAQIEFKPLDDPRFHPGRQAGLTAGGQDLGCMGQVLPDVAEALDIPKETFVAEIDLDVFAAGRTDSIRYAPISAFPSVRRDMALLVPKFVPYGAIEAAIRNELGSLAERIWPFDIFRSEDMPEDMHSIAVAVVLRRSDRTLTDEEANEARERAVSALKALGARLR